MFHLQRGMTRDHQSVYDKALTIFQERTKKFKVAEQEIEKERMQTYIDYKFEERKVKEDLIKLTRDRKRFARDEKSTATLFEPGENLPRVDENGEAKITSSF